jgi:hypothetical protein
MLGNGGREGYVHYSSALCAHVVARGNHRHDQDVVSDYPYLSFDDWPKTRPNTRGLATSSEEN